MLKFANIYDQSPLPLYLQVAAVLRQRIEAGDWPAGTKVPTLEELETEFQVAYVTVRQAVAQLQKEGLLVARQGRGTFVLDRVNTHNWLKLTATWRDIIAPIEDNELNILSVDRSAPPPKIEGEAGDLAPSYVAVRSLQVNAGEPYSVVHLRLARRVFDLAPEDFQKNPALSVLADMTDVEIAHAYQTMVIGGADPATAELLKVGLGSPTVECRSIAIDTSGEVIYVSDIIYRGDRIKIHIDFSDNFPPGRATAPPRRSRKKPA